MLGGGLVVDEETTIKWWRHIVYRHWKDVLVPLVYLTHVWSIEVK